MMHVDGAQAFVEVVGLTNGLMNLRIEPRPLEPFLVDAVQEANRVARLGGLDKDGEPLLGLAPSTLKRRQGDPTPLVEHGSDSRVIRNLVVIVDGEPNRIDMRLTWPGAGWLRYHAEGAGHNPVRDVFGLPPGAGDRIAVILDQEIDEQIGRIFRAGFRP